MSTIDPVELRKNKEERNKLLVDWSTAIFAVFWSVWWVYVADKVLQSQKPLPFFMGFNIPMGYISCAMALYVAAFAHEYVRWMWLIRKLNYDTTLIRLRRIMLRLSIVLTGLITATEYFRLYVPLETNYARFGYILTNLLK